MLYASFFYVLIKLPLAIERYKPGIHSIAEIAKMMRIALSNAP